MKVGVLMPAGEGDAPGGMPTFAAALAFARAAEAGGLDSGWLADHFFYRDPEGRAFGLQEAWTWLAAIAAATTRIELGHLVVCTSFRPPALTAKLAVTLDAIAPGRFTLGLGCGWHEAEYQAMGLPFDHRVGRFEEALAIITGLLGGEEVTLHGRWYEADRAVMAPAPPADRRIPVLIAATRERMLDLTARHADAWNTAWYGLPDDRLATRIRAFDDARARAGRSRADCALTIGINIRDEDQPPPPEPDPRAIGGSVSDLADALRRYEDLGAAHLMAVLEPMTVRSAERLTEAVHRWRGRATT
jgi:alkanesulfonate monooxygenase SsuD/methylene tetrahydromethanopterin reductase-like flavin-dependent oxidoreductase (luciferase family)